MSDITHESSIATRVFNKFYTEYRGAGEDSLTILFNLLPQFVEEISDTWGYELSIEPNQSSTQINGSSPFMEALDMSAIGKIKRWVITGDGKVYTVGIKRYETGGVTWNGDDEYYKNFATDYVNPVLIGIVTNIKSMDENLTSEKLENIAAEIISVTMQ